MFNNLAITVGEGFRTSSGDGQSGQTRSMVN